MEPLHAPWRIEYILSPKPASGGDSVFKRIGDSGDDVANLVIARGRSCYVVLNRHPYNGGHLMVVPYRQVAGLEELTEEETVELMHWAKRGIVALRGAMKPDGFNVGLNLGRVAGAGIEEHLHLHVVPRWQGDTNFMPVLGSTAVLPQALEEVADNLRRLLAPGGGA
jgi:ATP adenylyltransferase